MKNVLFVNLKVPVSVADLKSIEKYTEFMGNYFSYATPSGENLKEIAIYSSQERLVAEPLYTSLLTMLDRKSSAQPYVDSRLKKVIRKFKKRDFMQNIFVSSIKKKDGHMKLITSVLHKDIKLNENEIPRSTFYGVLVSFEKNEVIATEFIDFRS